MGSSRTPAYVIEMGIQKQHGYFRPFPEWKYDTHGIPNDENLKKYIGVFELSTLPEGVNSHLGVLVVETAKIIHQKTGESVAFYANGRLSRAESDALTELVMEDQDLADEREHDRQHWPHDFETSEI